jgi:sugar phosphate permease
VPVDKAITNWFVKKRGVALGTKSVIQGLSGVIVLPLIAFLLNQQGWRMTFLIGGLVAVVVGLPLVWFCIKPRRPEYYGLLPDGARVEEGVVDTSEILDKGVEYATEVGEVEFTLRQAMRTRAYWLIIIANAAHGMGAGAIGLHLIPYLTDIGIDPIKAAGIMAVMVFSSLPARFIAGFVLDRLSRNRMRFVIAGGYFIQTVAFAIFLLNPKTMFIIYVWLILYGVGMGIGYVLNVMVGRYYGRKAYGSIRGSQTMFLTPFSMVAPIFAGWVYDTTESYMIAFFTLAVGLVLATVIMAVTTPPKPPAQITDVRKIL